MLTKLFIRIVFSISFCGLFLAPLKSDAQNFPKQPEPWRDAYDISLAGFEFSHPMTVSNRDELEILKQRISDNIEPQKTAYEQLISEAAIQLDFTPDPPSTMHIMGGYEPNSNLDEMRDWLWRNCHAAYTCALAYTFTDDVIYAEKAKEILMDWANTNTTFSGNDSGLQLGSWFSPMLYAADLIYNYPGWEEAEKTTFKNWWRNNCLLVGDVIDVMRRKDNNWKDAGLLGVLSAAVVLEDTLLLKEGLIQLKSYFYSRTDDYVRIPGSGWKIRNDANVVYLPREVIRNDGRSGLTYTAYALTTMTQCLEIARYAGFNYWNNSTQEGATIKELIEQYFKWDIENETFPWNSNPKKSSKRRNCYELANIHFELDSPMKEWIKNNRPIKGREGDEYITLTKGDLYKVTTDLSEQNMPEAAFHLSQNYPNPFNNGTNIRFEIQQSEKVSIIIYNSLGQVVKELANKIYSPGGHNVYWDASNKYNSKVGNGIYFYKLAAGKYSTTKAMIVLK